MSPRSRGRTLDRERYLSRIQRTQRIQAVLDRLAEKGSVTSRELCRTLGASSATVRRDLEDMERRGLLSRVHGGAVANGSLYELPLDFRGAHRGERRRIAQRAAEFISPGMKVGLTGGTTTAELARVVADLNDLTVVTNAMNIGWHLVLRPNIRLMLTGGVARPISYELIGPLAELSISEVNVDVAFMGADGISLSGGITNQHDGEAATIRALIHRATSVYVVADRTKFERQSFSRVCAISDVDGIITDREINPEILEQFKAAGVEMFTC